MLYIDKYIPKTDTDFVYNLSLIEKIKLLSKVQNIPHIILNGPAGCGKKTLAHYFIKEKYGRDFLVKNQIYEIKHSTKKIEINIKYSLYHWQLNPSIYGVYDRTIIQELIKDVLKTKAIGIDYHIIIIEDAHLLTKEAQQCLRRILEKYIENCRFIFLVNHESCLINALTSRCLQLRLSAPTNEEIVGILSHISMKEDIISDRDRLSDISNYSQRNLKHAINLFQTISVENPNILNNKDIIEFSNILLEEKYINNIIDSLLNFTDISTILSIRNYLYDLLVHCVDPIKIIKKIYLGLLEKYKGKNDNFISELTNSIIEYEHTIKYGSKPIYHLEGFIISIMNNLIK